MPADTLLIDDWVSECVLCCGYCVNRWADVCVWLQLTPTTKSLMPKVFPTHSRSIRLLFPERKKMPTGAGSETRGHLVCHSDRALISVWPLFSELVSLTPSPGTSLTPELFAHRAQGYWLLSCSIKPSQDKWTDIWDPTPSPWQKEANTVLLEWSSSFGRTWKICGGGWETCGRWVWEYFKRNKIFKNVRTVNLLYVSL